MLAKYSFAPMGPWGSLRPAAYDSTASRVVPLAASNMPTAWTNPGSPPPGSDSPGGGLAARASARGSIAFGRLYMPGLRNIWREAPTFGGLYGSYAVTVGTTSASHPSRSQTIDACSGDWIRSILSVA